MKYLHLFILLFILSCTSNRQERFIGKDSTDIFVVDTGDEEMEAAIASARASLNKFDSALSGINPNYYSFSLKVRFPYGESNGEHIWLTDIEKVGDAYRGVVNNEPEYVTDLELYDTVRVEKMNISDWMYLEKDLLIGGFTIRLIRNRMTASERAAFDSTSFFRIVD